MNVLPSFAQTIGPFGLLLNSRTLWGGANSNEALLRERQNQIKSNQIKSNQIKSNQIKSNQIKLFNDGTLSNTLVYLLSQGAVYVYARIFVGKCPHFLALSKSLSRRTFLKRFGSSMA